MLVKNMSEALNRVLHNTRTKPIISMLEDIWVYMITRWAKNRLKLHKFSRSICPKIMSKREKESDLTKY